jgi:hypothetical protein
MNLGRRYVPNIARGAGGSESAVGNTNRCGAGRLTAHDRARCRRIEVPPPTMKRPSSMIAQAPAVLDSKGGLQGLSRPTGLKRPALGHTQFESCSGFTEAIFGGHCQYIAGRESLSYNAVDIFPRRLPRVLLDTRPGFVESRVQKKPSGSTHCHELIVKVQHSLSSWGKGLEQLAPSGKLCFS